MKVTIRNIAYVIIFVLLGAVTFQSYLLSTKIDKLNMANDNLKAVKEQLAHKQDSINLLSKQSFTLQLKADSLGKVAIELKKYNNTLVHQLENALSHIDSIPPEENYIFLKDTAYVYPGELKFPFNAKQVTEMRKTFAENLVIKKINVNLATTINVLQKQNNIQDSIISNQYIQLNIYSGMVKTLTNNLDIKAKENTKLYKDVINQKRVKYLFEGTTFIGVVYILISLI